MAVTPDKYELPLAVASSCYELANMLGINQSTVCKLRRNHNHQSRFEKYKIVWVENDEQ